MENDEVPMTNVERIFEQQMTKADKRNGPPWKRGFVVRHSSFVIYAAATVSAFAIGGVDTQPSPAAPSETKFAQPNEARLDNGLRVIVVQRPALPLIAAHLVVNRGAEADAAGLAGTASMT